MPLEQAIAHLRAGRLHEAIAGLEEHLRKNPQDAQGWLVLCGALEDAGRAQEALARYDFILENAPTFEDARHNRGVLLVRLGRLEDAERNARDYVAEHPGSPRAHGALADVLLALGRYSGAVEALERILASSPNELTALVRRGIALAALRRFADAEADFARARAADPAGIDEYVRRVTGATDVEVVLSPQSIYLWRRYVAQGICDWSGWEEYLAEFGAAASDPAALLDPALAFAAFHLPLAASERHAVARNVARRFEERLRPFPPAAARNAKIRIGILSPDFREHLNAYLLLPLIELLDRQRFDLYAYSLAADDGSAIRKKVRAAADCFRDLAGMEEGAAASRIREDAVDILLDAGGQTTGARFGITARRPAKLQISYLGFAGSLGSKRVDYAIVDAVVAPPGTEDEWSEALVRLPHTYYLYDFREPVPGTAVSRRDYGLPEDAFVYCAFHKAEKIVPDTFALWMEILSRVDASVLWFLTIPAAAAENLRAAARMRGIDPTRLHFAPFDPRDRYLARQKLGDLMLDALHHNAMTTACDALAAGLPVLGVRGSAMTSRAGESLLIAAGMPELVAPDVATFRERAVELALHPMRLKELRARLERNRGSAPLFDTASRIRQLEGAFRQMHERATRGDRPTSFEVAAR